MKRNGGRARSHISLNTMSFLSEKKKKKAFKFKRRFIEQGKREFAWAL